MTNIIKFLVLVAVLGAFAGADALAAEGKKRAGAFTNRAGNTGAWQQNVERDKGEVNKNIKWNNSRGGEGTSQYQRKWDKETGTGTSARTTTNAQGKTATTNKNYTKNEDGSAGVEGSHTGYGGKTSTFDKTFTKNSDGTISIHKTHTGPQGGTGTSDSTLTKTETGWTREESYSNSMGRSGTYTQTGTKTEDSRSVQTSVTNDQGKTWSREAEYERDAASGGYGRTVTQTSPQGETRSWWSGIKIEQSGYGAND